MGSFWLICNAAGDAARASWDAGVRDACSQPLEPGRSMREKCGLRMRRDQKEALLKWAVRAASSDGKKTRFFTPTLK